MQVRCPRHGGLIDVPDDPSCRPLRCPTCDWPIDLQVGESHAEKIQTETSPGFVVNKVPARPDLEHQIYDGLPPLSIMLALRAQRESRDDELVDIDIRRQMTEDDWLALDAFEVALRADSALKTCLIYGAIALVLNVLVWYGSKTSYAPPWAQWMLFCQPISLPILGAALYFLFDGRQSLQTMELGLFTNLLPWAALVLLLGSVANAWLNVLWMFHSGSGSEHILLALFSVPCNLIAVVEAGTAGWRSLVALRRVRPPEIAHLLREAMQQLEAAETGPAVR